MMISPEVTHLKKKTMTAKATMTLTTSPIASVSVFDVVERGERGGEGALM